MDDLLAAEEQLEQAWCDLDREWHRLLREAHEEAARIVLEAETEAAHVVRDAHVEAGSVLEAAEARAAVVVESAEGEAAALLLEAQERADRIVHEARAAAAAASATPAVEDPTGIREALQRLRSELSNVVDAALDAFPTIEATADLFGEAAPVPAVAAADAEPVIDLTSRDPVADVIERRPGRLRRLLRLA